MRIANKRAGEEPEDSSGTPAASAADPATQPADPDASSEAAPSERRSASAPAPASTPASTPAPAATPVATATAPDPDSQRRRGRSAGDKVRAGSRAVRSKVASLVWLVAVVCALFLAVGALLIALNANQDNSIVQFVLDGADLLDGPFSRENGPFTFDGKDAQTKSALVNWGLAAVVYLVIGKIADRIIRP